jgi:uncharacterized protein
MTILLGLSLVSGLAWFFSMLAGGGSPLILIPVVGGLLGPEAVAPVITVGMLVGNGQRSLMFWRQIHWGVTAWYLPGALAGAVLGAWLLSRIQVVLLEPAIGVVLVAMALNFLWGRSRRSAVPASGGGKTTGAAKMVGAPKTSEGAIESAVMSGLASGVMAAGVMPSLPVPQQPVPQQPVPQQPVPQQPGPSAAVPRAQGAIAAWYFLPAAFLNGVGSALIGSTGPILNPLYLRYGLVKEDMIATKSFHKASLHLVKIGAYALMGNLTLSNLWYGLIIGAAALPANWLGQKVLQRMTDQQFKDWVYGFVAVSGGWMVLHTWFPSF